ncbi:MAG: hypothetical protein KKF16_10985 [Euryarchaeota archaeon]|nr:hypothetical protein [Euryarchaeota archaeon]MBV1756116.1 hypothetical protein [Methanobacterium sp.]
MTRRQFLKKSKKALKDTSHLLVMVIEITGKEDKGKISPREVDEKWEIIRQEIESIFAGYEKIKPPSKCISFYRRILNILVDFQEMVTYKKEYLRADDLNNEEIEKKRHKTSQQMEILWSDFKTLNEEVTTQLSKK